MRNTDYMDNNLVRQALRDLQRRLPPGWKVGDPERAPAPIDAKVRLTAPDKKVGLIVLEARCRLDPKGVVGLLDTGRTAASLGPLVVLSEYLSPATRDRLREGNLGYLDLTGNARIVVAKPGLFIETQGATEDPDRQERLARSLRGPKAGRIVRALVDRKRPPGVRELASATGIDAGYVSRVLAFLDSQALIVRVGHGRTESVDWPALLRRWATDAPIESRGQARTYLDPRGIPSLVGRLAKSDEKYAVTCAVAAARFAPVAPARLATVWLRDSAEAATRLGLRPADAGANILLVEPKDSSAFEGATKRDGVWYAGPSQVVADLLSGPGRGPAEAEELISWMRKNEKAWRQ